MVQAPGFIRGINPKSKIKNPQAPAFIRGVNLKSQISNLKSIDCTSATQNLKSFFFAFVKTSKLAFGSCPVFSFGYTVQDLTLDLYQIQRKPPVLLKPKQRKGCVCVARLFQPLRCLLLV